MGIDRQTLVGRSRARGTLKGTLQACAVIGAVAGKCAWCALPELSARKMIYEADIPADSVSFLPTSSPAVAVKDGRDILSLQLAGE